MGARSSRLKRGLAAATCVAAAGVVSLSGCGSSGEEGSSGKSAIGGLISGESNEVLFNKACAERGDLYNRGVYYWDGLSERNAPYRDLEMMLENTEIPDGVGGLFPVTTPPVDLDTLTDDQKAQLWESYQSLTNDPDVYRTDIQAGAVVLYGDEGKINEYGDDGYPESMSDGVIDSPDLRVCVVGSNWESYIKGANFIGSQNGS